MAKLYKNNNLSSTITANGITTTDKTIINGAVPENSPVCHSLKQKISPSVYWTREEQSMLEELITKYASDSMVRRYAKIAVMLQSKTITDVALRCRWMTEKAAKQQMKPSTHATIQSNGLHHAQLSTSKNNGESVDDELAYKGLYQTSANVSAFKDNGKQMNSSSSRKHIYKKGVAYQQVKPSSHATTSIDSDEDIGDKISYRAIGGATARLLEENDMALNQIAANVRAFKLHENINLEIRTRNNINALLYESFNNMPEMKQSARQLYDFPVLRRVKKKLNL